MKPRFDELLPFYVNGSLPASDRLWVEDYLRDHPVARAELQWYESLQTRLREDAPPVSSEVGMERALHRIRTEGPMPQGARRATPPQPTNRLRDWLASFLPQPIRMPALATALAVIAVQAGVIATLVIDRDDSSEMRALKPGVVVAEKGPYLKVNFKTDAREAEIRMLLVEVRGSLVAGPSQLGDYYMRVPEPQLAATTEKLSASGIVEAVAVVDALPARR